MIMPIAIPYLSRKGHKSHIIYEFLCNGLDASEPGTGS